MNGYDLLSLMDTYDKLKQEGVKVPGTLPEFIQGVRPLGNHHDDLDPQHLRD